jgi:hypothetical protein
MAATGILNPAYRLYYMQAYTKEWWGFRSYWRIYFLPYTGATYTATSGNCPDFSCDTVVRFSCLLRGRATSFQDGITAGDSFLCAAFWGVQICDYSIARVSFTVITVPLSASDITSKIPAWNQAESWKIPYSPHAFTLVSSWLYSTLTMEVIYSSEIVDWI